MHSPPVSPVRMLLVIVNPLPLTIVPPEAPEKMLAELPENVVPFAVTVPKLFSRAPALLEAELPDRVLSIRVTL